MYKKTLKFHTVFCKIKSKLSNTVKQSKFTDTCITFRNGLGLYFMGIYVPDYL